MIDGGNEFVMLVRTLSQVSQLMLRTSHSQCCTDRSVSQVQLIRGIDDSRILVASRSEPLDNHDQHLGSVTHEKVWNSWFSTWHDGHLKPLTSSLRCRPSTMEWIARVTDTGG